MAGDGNAWSDRARGLPSCGWRWGILNPRLRYVLGEHDEPPRPDTGHVDLYVGFAAEDDETVRWQVAVRSTTLPLSAEFDVEQRRLLSLAAQHGGRDGGWGSA